MKACILRLKWPMGVACLWKSLIAMELESCREVIEDGRTGWLRCGLRPKRGAELLGKIKVGGYERVYATLLGN